MNKDVYDNLSPRDKLFADVLFAMAQTLAKLETDITRDLSGL